MKFFKAAVIGKDVSKSLSPKMHKFIAEKLGYTLEYAAISIPEEKFESKIGGLLNEYDGLNITIPYKLSIIPYLKNTLGDARVFGAVNVVNTKAFTGYNTDGAGFALMLKNGGIDCKGKKVLLLGAGGAGRSVAKTLSDGGAFVFVYDKNTENAKALAKEFGAVALTELNGESYYAVINATGVGMHKSEGISPVGEEILKNCEAAVDLIYVPEKSEFLRIAEALGKKIMNGTAMLFYQAYFGECIFFDEQPDEKTAKALFEEFKF